jgi:hypothetical protein
MSLQISTSPPIAGIIVLIVAILMGVGGAAVWVSAIVRAKARQRTGESTPDGKFGNRAILVVIALICFSLAAVLLNRH